MRELPTTYDPSAHERAMYDLWLRRGCFSAPAVPVGERFCIVIPPPNVTGRLHMGHALDNTLQDVLVRWRRLQGRSVLWLPGTDHAGIATQAVVERRLAEEGSTRRELGREAFLERVWAWKREYEQGIVEQLRALGASCDWSRQRFTLDPGLSRAVEEVFLRYYREGLIYRGDYIVNWCPRCGTAISDLEVEHEERPGRLYRIRYPLVGGGGLVIATVRPETMLGDTAIAVNPEDARHAGFVGRTALVPLVDREVPVVADGHVDPEFGTGALKVTPAHDADDFAIAQRHGLPAVTVIGTDGRLTFPGYEGLTREEGRAAVVDRLAAAGLLEGEEPYTVAVGLCSRCGEVVEPLVSRQWFVRMRPLAEPAIAAVRDGRVRFVPDRFARVYLQWMENVRDWCISRQLWWGHRIPAWECEACDEVVVARESDVPDGCPRCGGRLVRDPDVLDTWFSSALWPFSTLGWPDHTSELGGYYPTDVLVTGYDIIFFWVARMIVSGLHFTGEVPFRTVFIHGLVRDAEGRKMSKSLGNGIDPLEVVARYGADALRCTLLQGIAPGSDTRFSQAKMEGSQRFCNKIWNASRFVLQALDGPSGTAEPVDRWIESRLHAAAAGVTDALARFEPGEAFACVHDFFWNELCDWYLEAIKPRLYGHGTPACREVLGRVFRDVLILLHPFVPFITETVWQMLDVRVRGRNDTLACAAWPTADPSGRDPDVERLVGRAWDVVSTVRSLRAEMHVEPGARVRTHVVGAPELEPLGPVMAALAGGHAPAFAPAPSGEPAVRSVLAGGLEVVLPLAGVVDVARETDRLARDLAGVRGELARVESRLQNVQFRTKAKPEVVEREVARRGELAAAADRLAERLQELRNPR